MSLDFRKTTYRPNRPHTRLGTSYGLMSQWMRVLTKGDNIIRKPDFPSHVSTQDPVHLQYSHQSGYDDFHKAYRNMERHLPNLSYPVFGPPRLRHGRAGGSWRHVKEVMQAKGRRTLFVDGQIRNGDNNRLKSIPGGNMLQPEYCRPILHKKETERLNLCHPNTVHGGSGAAMSTGRTDEQGRIGENGYQ